MKLIVKVDESRLAWPLRQITVGALSSATFHVVGAPPGVQALEIRFSRPGSDTPFAVRGDKVSACEWKVYAMPFCFPEAAMNLEYQIIAVDAEGNRTWLGTGILNVVANSAAGSATPPPVIPADTYIRNPVTGLYHKLVAEVDEDGIITVAIDQEGITK